MSAEPQGATTATVIPPRSDVEAPAARREPHTTMETHPEDFLPPPISQEELHKARALLDPTLPLALLFFLFLLGEVGLGIAMTEFAYQDEDTLVFDPNTDNRIGLIDYRLAGIATIVAAVLVLVLAFAFWLDFTDRRRWLRIASLGVITSFAFLWLNSGADKTIAVLSTAIYIIAFTMLADLTIWRRERYNIPTSFRARQGHHTIAGH
jgi:hypothetical protein